jgi:hypothetical protein
MKSKEESSYAVINADCAAVKFRMCRSQWPRCLMRGCATACLLGLWVRIPPGARVSVSCECCVLSGRGLCDGPFTRQRSPTECGVSVIVKPR